MYQVPESKRSLAQNQFEFTTDGKNKFTVPKVQYLSLEFIEKAQAQGHGIEFVNILAEFGNKAAVDAVRKLDGIQLSELAFAWQEASTGVTPGESSASTD